MTFIPEKIHVIISDYRPVNYIICDFYFNHTPASKKEIDEEGNEIVKEGYEAEGWRYGLAIPFSEDLVLKINKAIDKFYGIGEENSEEEMPLIEMKSEEKTKFTINDLPQEAKEVVEKFLKKTYVEIAKEKGYNIEGEIVIGFSDFSLFEI